MTSQELNQIIEAIRKTSDRVALSVTEAAAAIGVSRPTMYNLIATEDFPSYKIGGKVYVDADGLREWSARNAAARVGY